MTPIQAEKQRLRQEALSRRAARSQEERAAYDRALCALISDSPAFQEADALFLYAPVRGEIDVTPLRALAHGRGIPVGYPRTSAGGEMAFFAVAPGESLTEGAYGVPSPAPTAPRLIPTQKTLLLVPMLMGDSAGYRLGYGGGYFDRYLPHFPGIARGVIYTCEIVEKLPRESFDLPLPAFYTQKGNYRYRKTPEA